MQIAQFGVASVITLHDLRAAPIGGDARGCTGVPATLCDQRQTLMRCVGTAGTFAGVFGS